VNSLEDDARNHVARISRLEKAIANAKGEIVHLRQLKAGGDNTKKVEKDLKEAEARVKDSIKKIEELVTGKAKVEAELVRMTKVCDLQLESIQKDRLQNTSTRKDTDRANEVM
jgi:predicted  nucleic acid-binding Zn-ribbon protein